MSEYQHRTCRPVCNYRIPVRQQYGSRSGQRALGQLGTNDSSLFGTDVCIANYAESGESANTFIGAKRLAKALSQIKKGDYLFMEFGHNDQKQKGPGKGAYYSFMTSLKTFIDEARARGAHPVLVTPTQRRSFDANGHIRDTRRLSGSDALAGSQRECSIDRSQ